MEAGIFILAGKKRRYSGGWRDSGSGIVAILAAVYFFWRHSGISPSGVCGSVEQKQKSPCMWAVTGAGVG